MAMDTGCKGRSMGMKITSVHDADYTANFHKYKAEFYLKGTLQIRVEARTLQQVKETLNNWSRLKIPVDDVLAFQKVSKSFIGCTVDDVQYSSDGKSFTINGKRMEYI